LYGTKKLVNPRGTAEKQTSLRSKAHHHPWATLVLHGTKKLVDPRGTAREQTSLLDERPANPGLPWFCMGQKNLLIREVLPKSKPPYGMKGLPTLCYVGFAWDKKTC
jgi:hypothetical protein